MSPLHADNQAIQRVEADVSSIRLQQVRMEGQHNLLNQKVDHLEVNFDEKHEENKIANTEIKVSIANLTSKVEGINITVVKWSTLSGLGLAIVLRLLEKWIKV